MLTKEALSALLEFHEAKGSPSGEEARRWSQAAGFKSQFPNQVAV